MSASFSRYFYLLVYATRPMYASCRALFEKFAVKKHWSRKSWINFVNKAPIELTPAMREDIWRFLSDGREKVELVRFVASWHIHQIDEPRGKICFQDTTFDFFVISFPQSWKILGVWGVGDLGIVMV